MAGQDGHAQGGITHPQGGITHPQTASPIPMLYHPSPEGSAAATAMSAFRSTLRRSDRNCTIIWVFPVSPRNHPGVPKEHLNCETLLIIKQSNSEKLFWEVTANTRILVSPVIIPWELIRRPARVSKAVQGWRPLAADPKDVSGGRGPPHWWFYRLTLSSASSTETGETPARFPSALLPTERKRPALILQMAAASRVRWSGAQLAGAGGQDNTPLYGKDNEAPVQDLARGGTTPAQVPEQRGLRAPRRAQAQRDLVSFWVTLAVSVQREK